jgi:hypothetical protein
MRIDFWSNPLGYRDSRGYGGVEPFYDWSLKAIMKGKCNWKTEMHGVMRIFKKPEGGFCYVDSEGKR